MAKLLPLVVVGILLGEWLGVEAWICGVGMVVCTLCAVVWRNRVAGSIYTAASVVLLAMTTTALRQTPTSLPYDTTITTTATITSTATPRGRWSEYEATIDHREQSFKVILRIDTALVAPELGQRGELTTMVRRLPEGSYGRLMHRRGFSAQCYTWHPEGWQPTATAASPEIWAKRCQQRLVERLGELPLTPRQAAVAKAMALGWRGDMTAELRSHYSRSGCAHLLAISGLHVGIVAMLVWALLWFMPLVSRRGHIWRNVIAMAAMVVYAVVTGMTPSVMRATLMFCTVQLGLAIGNKRSSPMALLAALTLMLLFNPNNLFDISFQLSAVAVVGIIIGFTPLMEALRSGSGLLNAAWGTVLIGVCSMVATLPITAHTFGVVGLAGIVLNPVVILTANVIVLGSIVWTLLPIGALAPVMGWIVGSAAEVQNRFVEVAGGLDSLVVKSSPPGWLVVECYVVMVIILVVAHYHKDRHEWRLKR